MPPGGAAVGRLVWMQVTLVARRAGAPVALDALVYENVTGVWVLSSGLRNRSHAPPPTSPGSYRLIWTVLPAPEAWSICAR